MKTLGYLLLFTSVAWSMQACNNPNRKDSVELAEEANKEIDTPEVNVIGDPNLGITTTETFSDANYAVEAADGGLMEVQLGKIALENAADQGVKDFGQMMVDDHSKANTELQNLAKEKNITLPPTPGEKNMEYIKDLNDKTGNEFDKAYIDRMVSDHKEDIRLFEMAAERAEDADIKAFADKTLPVLRKHLAAAETLKEQLKTTN